MARRPGGHSRAGLRWRFVCSVPPGGRSLCCCSFHLVVTQSGVGGCWASSRPAWRLQSRPHGSGGRTAGAEGPPRAHPAQTWLCRGCGSRGHRGGRARAGGQGHLQVAGLCSLRGPGCPEGRWGGGRTCWTEPGLREGRVVSAAGSGLCRGPQGAWASGPVTPGHRVGSGFGRASAAGWRSCRWCTGDVIVRRGYPMCTHGVASRGARAPGRGQHRPTAARPRPGPPPCARGQCWTGGPCGRCLIASPTGTLALRESGPKDALSCSLGTA